MRLERYKEEKMRGALVCCEVKAALAMTTNVMSTYYSATGPISVVAIISNEIDIYFTRPC